MKKLRLRILAIAILAPMAAFGAIGSASAASQSPAAVRGATVAAASTTTVTPVTVAHSVAAYAQATAQETPSIDPEVNVSPRVGCGGANGVIEWSGRTIHSWGEAWDLCGSGTYVQIFLSWYSPTYHNVRIATAGPHSTVGFNTGVINNALNVGKIGIAACEHDNGWHCGATVHV
jgi:hypothetical protein